MTDYFSRVMLSQACQCSSFSSSANGIYKKRVRHPKTLGQIRKEIHSQSRPAAYFLRHR